MAGITAAEMKARRGCQGGMVQDVGGDTGSRSVGSGESDGGRVGVVDLLTSTIQLRKRKVEEVNRKTEEFEGLRKEYEGDIRSGIVPLMLCLFELEQMKEDTCKLSREINQINQQGDFLLLSVHCP